MCFQSKEKKAALEKEREERIAEAEIENLTGARHVESQKLASLLAARHLEIKQIPSDGHCMYRAIEDQLKDRQNSWTVTTLRNQTAKYMQSHFDDFLPFLTNPTTGDMYSRGKNCIIRDFRKLYFIILLLHNDMFVPELYFCWFCCVLQNTEDLLCYLVHPSHNFILLKKSSKYYSFSSVSKYIFLHLDFSGSSFSL